MISYFLSGFRWYRKMKGGRWEKWFIDFPVGSDIWFHNLDERPGLARGLPEIEDYNPKVANSHPYR